MIDPRTVLIMVPTYDGRNEWATTQGLCRVFASGMAGGLAGLPNCTGPALARNVCVNRFLQTSMEWLVFIDADIGFTPEDFAILMDYQRRDGSAKVPLNQELHDAATLAAFGVGKESIGVALIVTAEYARKSEGAPPARLGLGFCRIHRSVFAALDALDLESGEARIDSFTYEGALVADYFLSGCSEHRWLGEDTGFFSLCALAGIHPRVEQRCQLVHVGKKDWPYAPFYSAQ
jgi:glycosyltransferase involved in cell wall biosynthesis